MTLYGACIIEPDWLSILYWVSNSHKSEKCFISYCTSKMFSGMILPDCLTLESIKCV